MNRFFIFFAVVLMVVCTTPILNTYNFAQQYSGKYYFYTTQNYNSNITTTTQNGNGYIISCDINKSKLVKNALNKNLLFGESFSFVGDEKDIKIILQKLDVFYSTKNNLDIIAYSPKIDYAHTLNGKLYNVQISKNNNVVNVGFPAILGGF